ncbi:MAG: hypothetical protein CO107_11325, partial [Deltaproteobacteria bacterium CG_4_9_14_3_um_filter_51_14]
PKRQERNGVLELEHEIRLKPVFMASGFLIAPVRGFRVPVSYRVGIEEGCGKGKPVERQIT